MASRRKYVRHGKNCYKRMKSGKLKITAKAKCRRRRR